MLILHEVNDPASGVVMSFNTNDHVPFGTLYNEANVATFDVLPVAPTPILAVGANVPV
jgi:hypothetical protein